MLCLAHRAQIQNRQWTVIVDVFVCVYLYLCICVFVCLYLCICICVFAIADKVVCRAHNRAQIENSSDYSRSCTTTGIVWDFSREPCYDVHTRQCASSLLWLISQYMMIQQCWLLGVGLKNSESTKTIRHHEHQLGQQWMKSHQQCKQKQNKIRSSLSWMSIERGFKAVSEEWRHITSGGMSWPMNWSIKDSPGWQGDF